MKSVWPTIMLFFTTVVIALPLGGCSFLIQSVADPIAQQRVKRLKLPISHAAGFSQCLQKAGGICERRSSLADALAPQEAPVGPRLLDTTTSAPRIKLLSEDGRRLPSDAISDALRAADDDERISSEDLALLQSGAIAADKARQVLNGPVQAKLNGIFNAARAARYAASISDQPLLKKDRPDFVIDIREFNDYLTKIEEATSSDGWEALAREGPFSEADPEDLVRRQYIATYFKAYFRNGKFYSVNLNGEELEKKIASRLREAIPGVLPDGNKDPYKELARKLFSELKFDDSSQRFIGKIASEGFVTRGGQGLKFPAVEAELFLADGKVQTNKIDYVAVGSDLVGILLHAIYDAHDRLPGVSNATGYSLPTPLGGNHPEKTNVDANEFGQIEARAARIEATVSAGIGRVVRGLGVVALNNEALATAIETSVGVAARKHAEKVFWCWKACELDASPTKDSSPLTVPDEVTIDIGIMGEPASVIGVARPAR